MTFKIIFGSWVLLMLIFIIAAMKSSSDADDADQDFLDRIKKE